MKTSVFRTLAVAAVSSLLAVGCAPGHATNNTKQTNVGPSNTPYTTAGLGITPSISHHPLYKVLDPGLPAPTQWIPPDVPAHLVDPYWIADPKNYEITTQKVVNTKVSVPILEYHEVNYFPGDAATLKPGQFNQEIAWLYQHHFHTINFGQLYAAMYYGYQLPSRPIILSFDDGYESAYLKVLPLLEKYRYQATVFMISGFVLQHPERNSRFPMLTAAELAEMQRSGYVDVESHTVHHTELSTVSSTKAYQELTRSAAALEKMVNHPIRFFCFPFGGYTAQDLKDLQKAGYLLATTEHQGYANASQGALTLDRIAVLDYTTMTEFKNKLAPSLQSGA